METPPLIATLVTAFLLAFILATIATRLKISPIVGYLVAGIACGPFTPGFVADQKLASELAEIGVVLLMFGVGLHFSVKELLAVRGVALPGALAGIAITASLGAGLGALLGWAPGASAIFGICLSVASTVVVLRSLEERRQVQTERGRILVGWLVVEDTAMVLALVLVASLASIGTEPEGANVGQILYAVALTIGRVAAFVAIMLIVGRRVIPAILHYVAHTGSRELFRLAVLTLSLGIAFGAAAIFGVSFALGAFFAGLVLAESTLSQQAARETLPLRDAFSVLFFVSVGMLFDPSIVWRQPLPVLATVVVIVGGKAAATYGLARLLGCAAPTSRYMAASLGQIGEFSFILAGLALGLGLLSAEGRDLVLAGSIFSILLNPIGFFAIGRWETGKVVAVGAAPEPAPPPKHAAVIGYGRVGSSICTALSRRHIPVIAIELEPIDETGVAPGIRIVRGNAANPAILAHADLANAEWLYVAVPDGFEAAEIVEQAKGTNPALKIIARVHSREEADHLRSLGVERVVAGEEELAKGMVSAALSIRRTDPAV